MTLMQSSGLWPVQRRWLIVIARHLLNSQDPFQVIVTSFLFPDASFSLERLRSVSQSVGRHRLVVDLSCRRRDNRWVVAMNKWQTLTDMEVTQDSISLISQFCSEFLIHAADVEGLCNGIDEDLVQKLGEWVSIPTTYAGGAKRRF